MWSEEMFFFSLILGCWWQINKRKEVEKERFHILCHLFLPEEYHRTKALSIGIVCMIFFRYSILVYERTYHTLNKIERNWVTIEEKKESFSFNEVRLFLTCRSYWCSRRSMKIVLFVWSLYWLDSSHLSPVIIMNYLFSFM